MQVGVIETVGMRSELGRKGSEVGGDLVAGEKA